MIGAMGRMGASLVLAISAALILIAVFASPGFYNVDETVYFMAAHALFSTGSLGVENGFEAFGSNDLKIWLLIAGPSGLAPQYPAGSAIAAAPLIPILGKHALMAINVAAAVGVLFATHALARRLFGDVRTADLSIIILAVCTFFTEYAVGHWPHMPSVFFTILALWVFLSAMVRDRHAWRLAFWSGLAVGAGLLFRLDGVLILPPIAAAAILYAVRPWQVILGGGAGLLPAMILLSMTNHLKFGTWNPISYGSSGGAIDPTSHLGAGIAMLLVLAMLVALRQFGDGTARTRWIVLIAFAAVCAALAVSPVSSVVTKFTTGAYALLIDSTAIVDPRAEVAAQADGTLLFWGLPKKALGQSLPWLGALGLLLGSAFGARRRAVTIVLLVFAAWTLPFILRSWHGGLGSNMRYFLPVVPLLAILTAWIVHRLSGQVDRGRLALLRGALIGVLIAVLWIVMMTGRGAQLHQIIATYILCAVFLICLAAGFWRNRFAALSALTAIGAGLGLSAFFAVSDFATTQKHRAYMDAHSRAVAELPGRVVLYGPPEGYATAIGERDRLIAVPERLTNKVDLRFVAAACDAGYRVLMPGWFARGLPQLAGRTTPQAWPPEISVDPLVEVTCE